MLLSLAEEFPSQRDSMGIETSFYLSIMCLVGVVVYSILIGYTNL